VRPKNGLAEEDDADELDEAEPILPRIDLMQVPEEDLHQAELF
jgi:hypothetical protein